MQWLGKWPSWQSTFYANLRGQVEIPSTHIKSWVWWCVPLGTPEEETEGFLQLTVSFFRFGEEERTEEDIPCPPLASSRTPVGVHTGCI